MKYILLKIAFVLSIFWKIIPPKLRSKFFFALFVLESRGDAEKGLKSIFDIKDKLNLVLNERALSIGRGIHPKHEVTKYHNFFVQNIINGQNVLDIGCGYGAVAKTVALKKSKSIVIGIDYDEDKLNQASLKNEFKNLKFLKFDATQNLPSGKWDIIILSNVLEHITDRIVFLKKIVTNSNCKKLLIRVPCFERSWEMPMRKKLGINYFSDNDHKIEHTLEEFKTEMNLSELTIEQIITNWGEIWAICKTNNY